MSEKGFTERLQQNSCSVVVDFWAPWCGPCRTIEPSIKRLGEEYAGRVDVWKINADEQTDLLRSLHIYAIPTLVAYHRGQEIIRHTGMASPASLSSLFEAALSGIKPVRTGPAAVDRLLRLGAGFALLFLAYQGGFVGLHLLLAGAGGLIAFSAVYDRCPIYRMVSTRLHDLFRRNPNRQSRT